MKDTLNMDSINTLTKEQENFFKDSRIRDKNGNLIPMWHGSDTSFNNFKNTINWFTKDRDYAEVFATWLGGKPVYYKAYLNCKNLFNCGDTNERVFELSPIKPYKFSRSSLALIRKLGIDEEDFKRLVKCTSATNEDEEYKLKLNAITRLPEFAELVKSKGYDSIYTIEDGHQCVGAFNPEDIKRVDNRYPTSSQNIDEDSKDEKSWTNFQTVIDTLIKLGAKKGISKNGPTLLFRDGTCLNCEAWDIHQTACAEAARLLGYTPSHNFLEYLEGRGVATFNGGNWEFEDRKKIVYDCKISPSEAQYREMKNFIDMLDVRGFLYVFIQRHLQQYALMDYSSDDIIKKIKKYFVTGFLEEEVEDENSLDEEKAITWGDLDYAKKTDTKNMMMGRGTGHFGTGFYFVGKDGPYGLDKDNRIKGYDYEPSRPIYEIELNNYNLYKPKDNDSAYRLHDALRIINNRYDPSLEDWLHKDINIEKLEDELYNIGWEADKLLEDIDDDFDDEILIDYSKDDLSNEKEETQTSDRDIKYLENIRKLTKEFINKYGLEEYVWEDLDNLKAGEIENHVKEAIEAKDKDVGYLEYALKDLSNEFNISEDKLLNIIRTAYNNKSSEDTISTQIFKALGYEGVDVTHLNHDAQGLSGLDNFSYGTVIYDLKPGTFKKIREPRTQGNIHTKDTTNEDLSKEQEEFFKDSKVRDEKGNLLVCYHGTENPGFKEFDARKGKSQFGDYKFNDYNINYFTTNKETASGYTDLGYEHDNNIYACYLNIVNPYIVNNETKDDMFRSWQNIKDRKVRDKEILYFERFYDKWKSLDKDLDAINKDMFYFNCKFVPNEDNEGYYDLVEMNNNTLGSGYPKMYAYSLEEYFDEDQFEEFRNALVGDYQGEDKEFFNYTVDNLIKWVLLMNGEDGTNYDGIIVPDITDVGPKGSSFMTGKTTDIITLKSSNQIKRIDNLKPTSSSNIDEDYSNEDIISFVEKNIGTSDRPIDGPSYVMPNGRFLTIWRSKIPVSKYSATGSATHRDVQDFLYNNGLVKYKGIDVDWPKLEELGCIRVNSGFEEYIWLPKIKPNDTQWASLLMWLDWYFRFHEKLTVGYREYAPKIYHAKDYTTDEILKKCKEAYARGYLIEDLDKEYIDYIEIYHEIQKGTNNVENAYSGYILPNGDWFDLNGTYHANWDAEMQTKLKKATLLNSGCIIFDFVNESFVTIPFNKCSSEQLKTLEAMLDAKFYQQEYFELSFANKSGAIKTKNIYDFNPQEENVDDVMKYIKLKNGNLQEKIVKKGSKWQVQSEKGRNLGTYDTKWEAEKRLGQVHYFKHMNEEVEERVDFYTYQPKEVWDMIQKGETYIADYNKGIFSNAYKELARILNLNNCPIFGAPDRDSLEEMIRASGLENEMEDRVLLCFGVPKSQVHSMSFYDWTDYMYFWVEKQEKDSISQEEAENLLRHDSGNKPTQLVVDRIEPKWFEEDLEENINEDINKYYRLELEDCWRNRLGLFTGAFEVIPTKETIENYPEDFEDLTQEERKRYYRFDELLNELSKIKSPGVDANLQNFKEDDIFAFTSNKYSEILPIIKEMRQLLKEMGFKLIVKELDIDDVNISYRDDDQVAFSKSNSSRYINESNQRIMLKSVKISAKINDREDLI